MLVVEYFNHFFFTVPEYIAQIKPEKVSGCKNCNKHTLTPRKGVTKFPICSHQLNSLSLAVSVHFAVWFMSFQTKIGSVKGWWKWTERADLTQFAVFREQNIPSLLFFFLTFDITSLKMKSFSHDAGWSLSLRPFGEANPGLLSYYRQPATCLFVIIRL